MRVYTVGIANGRRKSFPICGVPETSPWYGTNWIGGKPLTRTPPGPVKYGLTGKPILEDYQLTNGSHLLVSTRLMKLVRRLSKSAKAYRSEIWSGTQLLSRDYWTVHFEKFFSCLNWDESDYSVHVDSLTCATVTDFVLRERAMPTGEHLFRVAEYPVEIIATERAKRAIEAAGMTGLGFRAIRASKGEGGAKPRELCPRRDLAEALDYDGLTAGLLEKELSIGYGQLTKKEQALFSVAFFALEVAFSGLEAYFANSGHTATRVIEGLKVIGARKELALFLKACKAFPGGLPSNDHGEVQARTLKMLPGTLATWKKIEDDLVARVPSLAWTYWRKSAPDSPAAPS